MAKRYQRCNQKPLIEEGQTTQWPKETTTKGQTTIYKTPHREPNIEQRKHPQKNSG